MPDQAEEAPARCVVCGSEMIDLGEFNSSAAGVQVCRQVAAYALEMARRGDRRPATHDLMREDGERWLRETRRERDPTLQ